MQIKKEEMRLSILKAGEDEFFDKGYDKASIRLIVKRAHTTIGNFYNYFDSKEALYIELVKDIYTSLTQLITQHSQFENIDQLVKFEAMDRTSEDLSSEDINVLLREFEKPSKGKSKKKKIWLPKNVKLWRIILNYIIKKYFPPIDRRFALLMTGSDTAPLSDARIDLQNLLGNHFNEHMSEYSPSYPHPELGSMIAHQLIEGLVDIGRHNYSKEKAESLTVEQILFIVIGVIGILKGGK